MRLPESSTAPSGMGGPTSGRTRRARRITNSVLHRRRFLSCAFRSRSYFYVARLEFVMTFANLPLDFFRDHVNRRVKIRLDIFGEHVGSGQEDTYGAAKGALRRFGFIVLEGHARLGGIALEVLQFADSADDVILDCFGEGHV